MACPLLRLSLGEVFGERTLCCVYGLYGRGKAHLARLLEALVLHDEVRIVGAHGIVLCRREQGFFGDDEGEPRHPLDALLRRGHADIDVHLVGGEGDHGIGRDGIGDHDCAVCMGECADLAHGVQDARARLLMRRVDGGDVGILCERALHRIEVGQTVRREGQVDVRHGVGACDFCRAR